MNPVFTWMPLIVAAAVALSGCGRDGYYYDRSDEYQAADMSQPLELPDSRRSSRYQDAMPVPDASNDFVAEGDFEVPRPQPLAGSRDEELPYVELREAGGDRWLLVNTSPGGVWPQLQGFVESRGLTIASMDASQGRIATEEADFRVRQGLRSGTSEVRCSAADAAGQCLTALQGYLDSRSEQAGGVSLAAQSLSQEERVRLLKRDDRWQLQLALGIDRAWSELHYQLSNNFTGEGRKLVDQNRSAGDFLVDYTPREDDGGWFDWFGDDAEPRRYRLHVAPAGAGESRVTVAAADDRALADSEARAVLDALASTLR
ncbi:outer membrane protein assembly factor BamC [Modicisalibacter radicis]|uniref:outer membrane protein assembly factor BamC n=1 Tax=Halomonas sp. EAR18 TaxID=2518972 RepID=UPI00109C5F4A|nr:outer membrane protein assembly factor BamC [Halomonas sp. EAR18]